VGFALLAGCSEEPAPPQYADVTNSDVPDEEFTDFVTQESDSGRAQWKLRAPKAQRYSKKKLIILDHPVIDFYDRDGNHTTTLIADAGEYSEETRDMLAFGNVNVRHVDGDVLETDSLFWNYEDDRIQSNSPVKLTRGRDVITGVGLVCDPGLNSVDIKSDVRATILGEDG